METPPPQTNRAVMLRCRQFILDWLWTVYVYGHACMLLCSHSATAPPSLCTPIILGWLHVTLLSPESCIHESLSPILFPGDCSAHPSLYIRPVPAFLLLCSIPAETYLLVEHQGPLQRPTQPVLEPALTAEHRWQADGCRHVAWGSTLPQVRQEKARPGALAHYIQSSCRLLVANVAYNLPKVCRVSKLLQFEGGEWGAVVTAAVENCREVPMGQCRLTQL